MQSWMLVAAIYVPLLILGLIQLFGVRRLASADTLKVFLWGLVFAAIAVPLAAWIGEAPRAGEMETWTTLGLRMLRIWLIIFGLAVGGRLGGLIFNFLWSRRPRPSADERVRG